MLPRPEQLMDMVGSAAAVKLAMEGAFDGRIKELKKAIADLEEKNSIVTNLDEALKVRTQADEYSSATRKKADDAVRASAKIREDADSRAALAAGRETTVAAREAAADKRQDQQDSRENIIFAQQKQRASELLAREEALEENEADYATRKKQLDADIRAFNQRLESLKV